MVPRNGPLFKIVPRITVMFHCKQMRIRNKKGSRKNTCSGCGNLIEESRKGQRYCMACHAANMRLNRPVHSKLKPLARLKANCRAYANVYLKRGKIKKKSCEICGNEAQMHHNDYSKPLEITWLCREHHIQFHSENK